MDFTDLVKPWALAYMTRRYSAALEELHKVMSTCDDSPTMELLLRAERSTLERMRGEEAEIECSFCLRQVDRQDVALVGLEFICRECVQAARRVFAEHYGPGWSLIESRTPATGALDIYCVFCHAELASAGTLVGTRNRFICATCAGREAAHA